MNINIRLRSAPPIKLRYQPGARGLQGPPGSVTDGDKGDIVVSGEGGTWVIDSAVLSAYGRTLIDDASAADARTTLGVSAANTPYAPSGSIAATNVQAAISEMDAEKANTSEVATALGGKQPLDPTLTALAGVATAANKLIYATGSDAFALTDFTALARTLLAGGTAAEMRGTLAAVQQIAASIGLSWSGTRLSAVVDGVDKGNIITTSLIAIDGNAVGYFSIPYSATGRFILQWGNSYVAGGGVAVSFPIAYPNACLGVVGVPRLTPGPNLTAFSADTVNQSGFAARGRIAANGGAVGVLDIYCHWLAWGF